MNAKKVLRAASVLLTAAVVVLSSGVAAASADAPEASAEHFFDAVFAIETEMQTEFSDEFEFEFSILSTSYDEGESHLACEYVCVNEYNACMMADESSTSCDGELDVCAASCS